MIRQGVAILQVVGGHEGAADVKCAGCSDGVEEESLDEAVGFRGCRRRGRGAGAGQALSGVVRLEWETSEKVCLQSSPYIIKPLHEARLGTARARCIVCSKTRRRRGVYKVRKSP